MRSGGGHTAVNLFEILFGVGLTYFGVRKWGSRHVPARSRRSLARPDSPARVERLNPASALMLGVLKQPWTLTAAAAIVIVQDHTALPAVVIAFLGFTAISTATVGGLFVYYSRQPGEAQARLETLETVSCRRAPPFSPLSHFWLGCISSSMVHSALLGSEFEIKVRVAHVIRRSVPVLTAARQLRLPRLTRLYGGRPLAFALCADLCRQMEVIALAAVAFTSAHGLPSLSSLGRAL